jgi:HSP20 family protein
MKTMRRFETKSNESRRPVWIEYGFNVPVSYHNIDPRYSKQRNFQSTGVSTPAVNIIETNDDFRIDMVAPGMKKESFKIELEKNVLSITYDHADNREEERKGWNYLRHEYNYHSFSRSFTLPETVNSGGIEASYEDGILRLRIPKKEEARKKPARQIAVD